MRKLWDKIVAWLLAIPTDKRLHFVGGFVVASFFGLALKMNAVLVPAIFAGFIKEMYDTWTGGEWDWRDFAATLLGGLLAQVFAAVGYFLF